MASRKSQAHCNPKDILFYLGYRQKQAKAFLVGKMNYLVVMPANDLKLEAPWEEVKEKLKELHLDLTDADLVYEPGNEHELLERVSHKIKKDILATRAWIESVSANRGIAS